MKRLSCDLANGFDTDNIFPQKLLELSVCFAEQILTNAAWQNEPRQWICILRFRFLKPFAKICWLSGKYRYEDHGMIEVTLALAYSPLKYSS